MIELRYVDAINSLRPDALFGVVQNNYDSIEWFDTEQTKPTQSEIDDELLRINNELKLDYIRNKRNELLIESDRYSLTDFPHSSDDIKQSWLTYRQYLRDITNNLNLSGITMEFNDLGDIVINNLTWPTPPS